MQNLRVTRYPAGSTMGPHHHTECSLIVVCAGEFQETIEASETEHQPGRMLFYPAFATHSQRFGTAGARKVIFTPCASALDYLHDHGISVTKASYMASASACGPYQLRGSSPSSTPRMTSRRWRSKVSCSRWSPSSRADSPATRTCADLSRRRMASRLRSSANVLDPGTCPSTRWFDGLDDTAAARVTTALTRIAQGTLSNVKGVREGVLEFRGEPADVVIDGRPPRRSPGSIFSDALNSTLPPAMLQPASDDDLRRQPDSAE
jgi:hypothetical protein